MLFGRADMLPQERRCIATFDLSSARRLQNIDTASTSANCTGRDNLDRPRRLGQRDTETEAWSWSIRFTAGPTPLAVTADAPLGRNVGPENLEDKRAPILAANL